MWTEKYRPKSIDEICLDQINKDRLISILNCRDIPNLIITGLCGNGKSSAVKIMTNEISGKYCKDGVLDLGPSDDRGIKFMQGEVEKFSKTNMP